MFYVLNEREYDEVSKGSKEQDEKIAELNKKIDNLENELQVYKQFFKDMCVQLKIDEKELKNYYIKNAFFQDKIVTEGSRVCVIFDTKKKR